MTRKTTSRKMIWRGELAAALLLSDPATADFVARNLGLADMERAISQPPEPDIATIDGPVSDPVDVAETSNDYRGNLEESCFWQPFRYESRGKLSLPPPPPLRWGWRNPPQAPPESIPIAKKSVVHPRLRAAVSSLSPGLAIDLPKVLRRLARMESMDDFPRKRLRRWGRQILVVVDHSDRLVPFFEDQAQLCRQLKALTPEGAITQLFCRDPNDEFVFVDAAGEYDTWQFGAPSRVIVLSDLGVLQRGRSEELRQRWVQWGRKLADHGFSVVALVPFPIQVAGHDLRREFHLVPWQRAAQHYVLDEIRRSCLVDKLLTAASPVVRLEPGLLRSLRMAIPEAPDASLESDVWQHPVVTSRHVDAATLDRRAMEERYCPTFAALPSVDRARFLTAIRAWRCGFSNSPEVWFQELLNLDVDSQRIVESLFPGDMQDAISGIHDLATRAMQGEEKRSSVALREYGGRAVDWLSVDAWNDSRIRQAVHDLWEASPTKRPPSHSGMDPALIRPNGGQVRVALRQRGAALGLVDDDRSVGSPIASITTGSRLVTVTPAELRQSFWKSGRAPSWASDWGRDQYGAWVEFQIKRLGAAGASGGVDPRGPITQRMRWIPPGTFQMGSPGAEPGRFQDEGPQHPVTLTRGFWLFDTLVTQELWRAVMGDNPSHFSGDRRPVEQVRWDDAQRFSAQLNERFGEQVFVLPGEAQWEYACRAGTTSAYSFGDDPALLDEYAWYGSNSGNATHDVATKKPNAWGLFDMHGNVLEWCQDYWVSSYDGGAVVDPAGPSEGLNRVLRGGSWNFIAQYARSAYRFYYVPGSRNSFIGFRCAQVPGAAEPQVCPTNGGGAAAIKIEPGAAARTPIPTRVSLIVVRSDVDSLELQKIPKPAWASAIGRDRYGLWAEFTVDAVNPGQPHPAATPSGGKRLQLAKKQAVATAVTRREVVQRLRWIPPGQFLMGSPASDDLAADDEKPQHEVTISHGYWLFEAPVTQELWLAVMNSMPSRFQSSSRLPVEQVSWNDCQAFLARINELVPGVNLSLPTEAEWEYACRAGTVIRYSFGDDLPLNQVNCYQDSSPEGKTTEVRKFAPNAWGLFDMHGNVWEWCQDWYQREYYGESAAIDPGGPRPGRDRVLRGGSWYDSARNARSASRRCSDPSYRSFNIGFRCAQVQQDRKLANKGGRVSE